MVSSLFNDKNLALFQMGIKKVVELLSTNMKDNQQPFSGILPHELAVSFQGVDLDKPLDNLDDALTEISDLYLKDAVYFHQPKYLAHLNCPITYQAILADLLATSINTAVETWDQSGGATFIEQSLIDWTVAKIGLGDAADGVFTSGGTQSNLMAMLLARDYQCQQYFGSSNKQQGLAKDFHRLKIFTSQVSHFSIQKAAAILGLGYDAVVSVPCDPYFRMDAVKLAQALEYCHQAGDIPMAVVATAGTTDFGSIDPLGCIAGLAKQYGAWFHVDAAYGGGLLITPHYHHKLAGIEQADSVTIDYHKSFFQPVSCSAFFVKQKKHLSVVTYHAEYLNPLSQQQAGVPDLCNKSIQTTRRFDALKLWLSLRTVGANSLGLALEQVMHLAQQAYSLLSSDSEIEVVHFPQLSTLVFRYLPKNNPNLKLVDETNRFIRTQLSRQGQALIAATKIEGHQYLKFTFLNCTTQIKDVQQVLMLIKQYGEQFLNQALSSQLQGSAIAALEIEHA
ncbi:putative decarboxylase [Pseudoalteromonas tunicata D2]|uniref:Putative decarboxylase n=2 Tax=Pseudoalteromonas tunicata TaxID=314281 RepID=A4CDP7_9GAMM|nr:putative decarboxylase [Pseudoalteromonas tunicata D2]